MMNRCLRAGRWAVLLVLVGSMSVLVACGGDDDGDGGSATAGQSRGQVVADAKERIAPYMGVPEFNPKKFQPPAPPFEASKAKGKVIFNIPISSALPFIKGIDEG